MTLSEITIRIVRSPLSEQPHLVIIEDGQQYYGTEAWRRYYAISGTGRRYAGTIDEVRVEYVEQCLRDGMSKSDIARTLGVSLRTVRNWFNSESQTYYDSRKGVTKAIQSLQTQQEEYEEEHLINQEAA